uniref:uncharacterized protein LOC131128091 isoform X2 n=1 Tax=Doryrhamphus excisus TaxID=161450 RepID=UPI0025AEB998|nr:uncharacterized protein LOC131128091 isoform X2 [Doryrhamphus excisus]
MATFTKRECGSESALLTPSKSKKPQTADNDVQQPIGHQYELPTQQRVWSSAFKQEKTQPPHVREEEEELWIIQERECLLEPEEADVTKLPLTGVSVKTEDLEDKPDQDPRHEGCPLQHVHPTGCRLTTLHPLKHQCSTE